MAGIHSGVLVAADVVDGRLVEAGVAGPGGGSIAGIADQVTAVASHLDALAGELARLVRDGTPTDTSHGAAARDAMVAAGALAHVSTVLSAVAFVHVEATRAGLDDGFFDEGRWAHHHTGLSNSEVGMCRRVSRCVARYPQIAEAFLQGNLRGYHLAAIDSIIPTRFTLDERTTAIEQLSSIQAELIAAARSCDTETQYRRFCAAIRRRLDTDGPTPSSSGDRSELFLRQWADGRWALHGDLSADDGALWATFLEEELRRSNDAHTIGGDQSDASDTDTSDTDASDTDASDAEQTREPVDAGEVGGEVGVDRLSRAVRLADAARALLLRGAASTRPGRVGLYVHLELNDLTARGGILPDTSIPHTEAGYDISDDTLWALLTDADITPVINLDGAPLSYGRTRRSAPNILRRVLAHRDQTCCFPGCDRPAVWNQQHHTPNWSNGGLTDPAGLRGLCREHHRIRHHDNWNLEPPDPDHPSAPGNYHATHPDGTPHNPTPRWQRNTKQRRRHDPYRTLTLTRLHNLLE